MSRSVGSVTDWGNVMAVGYARGRVSFRPMLLPQLHRRAHRVRLRSAALVAAGALLGACGGDGRFPAQFDTETFSLSVGAINGTPIGEPAAVAIVDGRAVRLDQGFAFDIAFDIDAEGRPVVLPPALVGSAGGASRPVGLQRLGTSWEAATIAPRPTRGWVTDSAFTMAPGETIGVRLQPSQCLFDFDPYQFAKVRVDSITNAARRLHLTILFNPNCGYRSLIPGRPAD
jgi:hypothetical protein